jgi:ABC-type sulfate/molybdate transport systems ATPase subunit
VAVDAAVMLDTDLTVNRGDFRLRAALRAGAGDVVAVVGPNGSGKSTLLRALAGLIPTAGGITIDGRDVADFPAQRRAVGWVPQDGALFPHLSARDNVAFGVRGHGRVDTRHQAQQWLDEVGVGELGDRRPDQLSGGQAQKVALARALARRPRLLLLDEPLAALDVAARTDVRRTLRRHLAAFDGVTLVVTHDPVDAATLAHRVLALEAGVVVQDAAPAEVARAPRTSWLAELMGANAFPGRIRGMGVDLAAGGRIALAEPVGSDGADALAIVAAHAVTLHLEEPRGSARNAWPVVVRELSATGSRMRVSCEGTPPVIAEVTNHAVVSLGLGEGVAAWASVKATEVTVVLL